MDEEHTILLSVIKEFVQREIQPLTKQIELTGIPQDLKKKLAAQGFLGFYAPSDLGGSELDRLSYSMLLEEIASESPSVAFHILMQNSFVINPLLKNKAAIDLVSSIVNGNMSGTLYYADLIGLSSGGKLKVEDGKITGTINGVLNSRSGLYIVSTGNNKFWAVTEGFEVLPENEQLGFRGMSLSPVKFNSILGKAIPIELDIKEIFQESYLPISAVAIGISKGALTKAIEYSKERSAFLHKLKDYQPLAFGMSQAYSQLEVLRNYFISVSQSRKDIKKELILKLLSIDFARDVSKLALQVHGGYGYLADFGIEKYYRDAMFLSSVGENYVEDRKNLSSLIFETSAGTI